MGLIRAALCLLFVYGAAAQTCTTTNFLNGPSGVVVSSNPYKDNAKCRWTINVPAGKAIELNFDGRFDIEDSTNCNYDSLRIYDSNQALPSAACGTAAAAPKVRSCGTSRPERFISESNTLTVEFCTDSSATGTGFEISYLEVGAPPPPPAGSTCSKDTVAQEVDGKHTVTFYSESEIPKFQDCTYKFRSKNNRPLKVTATKFSLEGIIGCRYDSLKIYNGATTTKDTLLGTFCGVNGPKNVRSTGAGAGELTLRLTTDEYTNGKGFSLDIEESCAGDHLCKNKEAGEDVCYNNADICNRTPNCKVDEQDESFCTSDCGAFDDYVAGQPFPGAAAITHIDGQIHCAGALINQQFVLTSAHCFHRLDDKPERFIVKLGAARLADAYEAQIEKITIHENWEPKTLAHNIAIIKLKSPVPIQKTIAPFCLPTSAEVATPAAGTVCHTLGWGRTDPMNINSYASTVKHISAPVVANAGCKSTIASSGSPVTIDNTQVCATTRTTAARLCFGDNGAPLACKASNGKWAVTGINNIAYSCTGTASTPSAFVRVAHYQDWIVKNAFAPPPSVNP